MKICLKLSYTYSEIMAGEREAERDEWTHRTKTEGEKQRERIYIKHRERFRAAPLLRLPPPSCLGAGCINTPLPPRANSAQQDPLCPPAQTTPLSSLLLVQLPLTPPTHLPLTSSN